MSANMLSVRIDDDLEAQLLAFASAHGLTRSSAARELLRRVLTDATPVTRGWLEWGRLGNNEGNLNGTDPFIPATLTDSWWFVLQNLEIWKDFYIEQDDTTGTPTITCELAPMYEQAVELRGL